MEVNAIATALLEVRLEVLQFRLREGMVHQSRGGFTKQIQSGEADVDGHSNGNQGIKHQPTREFDQHDGHHDPNGCPDIAEQVLRISPQRDRAETPRCTQQQPGHSAVKGSGNQGKGQTQIHRADRFGIEQASSRSPDNPNGGHNDEGALEATGEVLRFGMAKAVVAVSGFGGLA